MCEPGAVSTSVARARPHWTTLYLTLAGIGLATLVAEITMPLGVWRTATRWVFAALAFTTMVVWVRCEAVALEQLEWCGCASSTLTVRIVHSESFTPTRPSAHRHAPVHAWSIDEVAPRELEEVGSQP
jgi:hypothetical protein